MNDDEFERRLKELLKPLEVNDPTKQWKAEMLAKARAKRDVAGKRPRVMVALLIGAWMVIGLIRVTMPEPVAVRSLAKSKESGRELKSPAGQKASAYTLFAARGEFQSFEF